MNSSYLINNKYKILEKISQGSFGSIYKAENIRTKENVAIKIEVINIKTNLLKNETLIYQILKDIKGVSSIKWFGKDNNNYYMVLNLLGESLQSLKNTHFFSLKVILQIGINIIILLMKIHDKGLIHRDIKPDNFLFGLNKERNTIYIIDFGFSKSFIINNKHIVQKKTFSLIGSNMYASINAHNFIEQSRRDDLESLGYMLLYLFFGSLSWQNIYINEEIIELKKKIIFVSPKIFVYFIKYVRDLKFDERPDYIKIINIFYNEIKTS